jgi:hypothetical protein
LQSKPNRAGETLPAKPKENKMYIVLTRDIINPDSQDSLYDVASIIPVKVLAELHDDLGLDETLGHVCMTIEAAHTIQNRILAGLQTS